MSGDSQYIIALNEDNFQDEVLASSQPVLVDFWAPWCGPCRMVTSLIEELSADFAGQAKVAKLNVDEYGQIASQYQIQAIPSLLFFKDGQVVDRVVGVAPKQVLADKLNVLLQNDLTLEKAA